MLLSLKNDLQAELCNSVSALQVQVEQLEGRMDITEQKVRECVSAHNVLVDSYQERDADIQRLKNKVTDLEDRSRRNNLKFRGIPETIIPPELSQYLLQLLKTLLPMENARDLVIDRAHHIAKPNSLPDSVLRDVLARIHFFHIKDRAMAAARKAGKLPDPFAHINIYADLLATTLARRRQFALITADLREKKILYNWFFPATLQITHQGQKYILYSPTDARKLPRQWGISTPHAKDGERSNIPRSQAQPWSAPSGLG